MRYVEVPGPVDVKAIRKKLGTSQSEFARRYGFSVGIPVWKSMAGAPPTLPNSRTDILNTEFITFTPWLPRPRSSYANEISFELRIRRSRVSNAT